MVDQKFSLWLEEFSVEQFSREKKKTHTERKSFTGKENVSQKKKSHGNRKYLTGKKKSQGERKLTSHNKEREKLKTIVKNTIYTSLLL